jgi:hypothetical protein
VLGDQGERAGPEGVDQFPRLLGEVRDDAVQGVRGADEDRRGHIAPAALGLQQIADRFLVEGVRADAVHGVGGQDDEFAALDGRRGLTQAGDPVGRIRAVVSPCH